MQNRLLLLLLLILIFSCKSDKKNTYATGEISVAVDPSFHNVANALVYRYMQTYPEAKIELKFMKERFALNELLNRRVSAIVMSRDLNLDETNIYTQKIDLELQPSYFAADALVFVVSKESPIKEISVEEIKGKLLDGKRNLIFDGANTSNTDYIAERFQLKLAQMKYSALSSNEEIIENLYKFPNHIGVISLNTISRPFGENAKKLRSMIRILPVSDGDVYILPELRNLKNQKYPFTRMLYFLTNEGYFGVSKGLIRYSCTDIGQKIVAKNGLQPFNLYKRYVKIE